MNAISFSVFGTAPIYCVGAVRNAMLASRAFPKWKCVFYVAASVPRQLIRDLTVLGADVRKCDPQIKNEMFQRFLIADDPAVERFIVRDTDSRITMREVNAVQAWIESGLPFHSMRDHLHHTLPMGGGLWGAVRSEMPKNPKLAIINSGLARTAFTRQHAYGLDQTFLTRYVWPTAKRQCLQHDSCRRRIFPESVPFPDGCKFGDWRFVGEVIDENDKPHPLHWQQRINYMTI